MAKPKFLSRIKVKEKLKVFLSQTKRFSKMRVSKISSSIEKVKEKKFYFFLMLSSSSRLGAVFPLPMPILERTQLPRETEARIERVMFKPSLRVAPAVPEPKIKVLAPENPERETSSRVLVGQRQKSKNSNSSFTEIKKSEDFLNMRGGGDEEDTSNDPQKNNNQNSEKPKRRNRTFFGIPFSEGFTPNKPKRDQTITALELAKKIPKQEVIELFTLPAENGKREISCKINEFNKFMSEAQTTLRDPQNRRGLIHLLEQYRRGNANPGSGTKPVPETLVSELRTKPGARVYFQETKDVIEVVAISDKNNQDVVIRALRSRYPKKN